MSNNFYYPNILPPETAEKIMRMALLSVQSPIVVNTARWLVRNLIDDNQHAYASIVSEINVIYQFVQNHVRYTLDPVGVELVYSPEQLLQKIYEFGAWAEDCDSQLFLTLSLLLALGRSCRISIVSFEESMPEYYTHIFIEVLLPPFHSLKIAPRWVVVDPSTRQKVDEMLKHIKHVHHVYPNTTGVHP